MEIVHAMVRGRAVGKGPVQAGTSLAAYPTAVAVRRRCRAGGRKTRVPWSMRDCVKPNPRSEKMRSHRKNV